MYYEIKAPITNADGKNSTIIALVEDELIECAVIALKKDIAEWPMPVEVGDCIPKPLRLAEIINERDLGNDDGLLPYTATLKADSIDENGKPKKVSWIMACAAPDIQAATNLFTEYLAQGYYGFAVTNVKEQKWSHFLLASNNR